MGRELQKKKNRSSIPKVKHKPKSKRVNPLGNAIIAANWYVLRPPSYSQDLCSPYTQGLNPNSHPELHSSRPRFAPELCNRRYRNQSLQLLHNQDPRHLHLGPNRRCSGPRTRRARRRWEDRQGHPLENVSCEPSQRPSQCAQRQRGGGCGW